MIIAALHTSFSLTSAASTEIARKKILSSSRQKITSSFPLESVSRAWTMAQENKLNIQTRMESFRERKKLSKHGLILT
ncbi:hypothetical protein M5K25_001762 [Dendrobium thyrsiflorum]|uniref:Uncharacterized protein n=1 Tax=Dendrobium thyrsiflorum TaxID=117978 RepID=A0ABD0VSN3_DENTH